MGKEGFKPLNLAPIETEVEVRGKNILLEILIKIIS